MAQYLAGNPVPPAITNIDITFVRSVAVMSSSNSNENIITPITTGQLFPPRR